MVFRTTAWLREEKNRQENNNNIPSSITIMSKRSTRGNKQTPVYMDKNGDSFFNPQWLEENPEWVNKSNYTMNVFLQLKVNMTTKPKNGTIPTKEYQERHNSYYSSIKQATTVLQQPNWYVSNTQNTLYSR